MTQPSDPWTRLYPEGVAGTMPVDDVDLVTAWRERVARDPEGVAVTYFDGTLTARELEDASNAFAVALADLGTSAGQHVGVYLQNIPAYPVILLALWKLGAVPCRSVFQREPCSGSASSATSAR